ncbi:hypothetical protein ACQ86N_28785 [Puia sp. P3]
MERYLSIVLLVLLPAMCFPRTWRVRPGGPLVSVGQAVGLASRGIL